MRYVVKPSKFRKTPLLLKAALAARKLVSYPGRFQPALDYTQDLFLAYPPAETYPNSIANLPASYHNIASFYVSPKSVQRGLIRNANIKTPEDYHSDHYIVRPMRHFGGQNYRITSDPSDYDNRNEYISPAIDKWREYRVFFVKGSPLFFLRKKPGPNAGPFDAWNHANGSFFQTVNDPEESPLMRSSFFADVGNFCVLRDTHLVAVDVLLTAVHKYAVTEVNFAPAVTIPSNIEVIKNALASRNQG